MKKTMIAVSMALLVSGIATASKAPSKAELAEMQLHKEIEQAEQEMPGLQISYAEFEYKEDSNMVHVDDMSIFIPAKQEVEGSANIPIFIDEIAYTFGPEVKSVEDIPDFSEVSVKGMAINLFALKDEVKGREDKAMMAVFAGDDNIMRMDMSAKQTMDKETLVLGIDTTTNIQDVGMSELKFSITGLGETETSASSLNDFNSALMQMQFIGVQDLTFHGHSSGFTNAVARYAAVTERTADDVKVTLREQAIKMIKKEKSGEPLDSVDKVFMDMVATLYESLDKGKEVHVTINMSERLDFNKVTQLINVQDGSKAMDMLGLEIDFASK